MACGKADRLPTVCENHPASAARGLGRVTAVPLSQRSQTLHFRRRNVRQCRPIAIVEAIAFPAFMEAWRYDDDAVARLQIASEPEFPEVSW